MAGEILDASAVTADVDLSCDVCIVGSGAGGAVLAAGLCERGLNVVMLEAGPYKTRRDFDLRESTAYPMLYQDRMSRATSDLGIAILQGRSVGGTTTVNWTTCYRTPDRILQLWRRRHGLELTAEELAPHFEAVEQRLSITEWPAGMANPNNQVLRRGCDALGWASSTLKRNVRGCANSGYCGLGCPVDGKQAMHVTYLPDALRAGLRLFAEARVDRLEVSGDRVVAVHARIVSDDLPGEGPRITVRPKVAVSSAGAINGPMLLIRSGLGQDGPVGRRTFLHPVVGVAGRHARPIRPYDGAPQSAASHQFIDRGPDKVGFFLEAAPLHPVLAGIASPWQGAFATDFMRDLSHVGMLIALQVDGVMDGDEGGTVSLKPDGRLDLDYPIRPHLVESFRASTLALVQLTLASGAERATTLHVDPLQFTDATDLSAIDAAPYGAHEHAIFSAHQMGGCAMGPDPATSVVDLELRHHTVPNLFVVDGSVFPTALGVNPSQSVYGLAHRARDAVATAV